MPYSINIPLQIVENPYPDSLLLSGFINRALHAVFRNWLKAQGVDVSQLVNELPDKRFRKKSSIQPLFTISHSLQSKKLVHFRITLLSDGLFEPLWKRIRKEKVVVIRHAKLNLITSEVSFVHKSYLDIRNSSNNYGKNVILDFSTPTTFKSNSMSYPLPDPVKVFGSLFQKWNHFVPAELGIDSNWWELLRESVRVTRGYPITEIVDFGDYKEVGFIGQVEYSHSYHKNKEENCKILNTLADFSFFSGVGAKTSLGMGQTQRIDKFMEKDPTKYPIGRGSTRYRLFISYSSKDELIVSSIADVLQKSGFDIWLDQKDIVIGQPILDRVREGLTKESDYVLIILSKNSTMSEWCKLELRMAYEKEFELRRVFVLPVKIDGTDIPAEVKTKKYFQLDIDNKESIGLLISQISSLANAQGL